LLFARQLAERDLAVAVGFIPRECAPLALRHGATLEISFLANGASLFLGFLFEKARGVKSGTSHEPSKSNMQPFVSYATKGCTRRFMVSMLDFVVVVPSVHLGAIAGLKSPQSARWRDCRGPADFAKRLCGVFTAALGRPAATGRFGI
jgi:hypothetical protein